MGLARFRSALRVDRALSALAHGHRDLPQLAAACGFADHAHLTRSIRDHLGTTPSALRATLNSDPIDLVNGYRDLRRGRQT